MAYDRVDDDDKFLYENIGIGMLHFHTTSHFKIKAKEFFS